jgi:hypothetical protein
MFASPVAAAAIAAGRWRIDYVGNASGRAAIYSADASRRSPLAVVWDGPMSDYASGGPLPSPDGRRIAFSDGREELIARGDGSDTVVLTRSFVYAAAWSPDSTRIAWFASTGVGGAAELHVTRADGTSDHVVRSGIANLSGRVVWSRDGRSVHVRVVTTGGVVSPDGHWIAAYTAGDAFVVTRTGTTQPVAQAAGSSLTWSPDSARLAYATASGIVVLDVRTGRTGVLTTDQGSRLKWSPDGSMLAYVDCCTNSTIGVGDIRTVTLAGSVRTVVRGADAGFVTELEWARAAPRLSYHPAATYSGPDRVSTATPVTLLAADGNRVAYTTCGGLYLWTPADGSVAAGPPLGDGCGQGASRVAYALALAGDRFAYATIAGGNVKSWAVSTVEFGQSPQLLTSAGGETCCTSYPVVAAEGSLVVYADRTGSSTYTWTVRVAGGQPLISFEQNRFVPLALDVDGDRVLVARDGAVDVVLSENGRTVFHLDVPVDSSLQPGQRKPPDAQLDGPFVVVRNGSVANVYAVDGGALLDTWPLPDGSTLQDCSYGLLAVSAAGEVYVIRLSDGLRTRVAPGTLAAFMNYGLAIATGAGVSVTPYSVLPSFAVQTRAASRLLMP